MATTDTQGQPLYVPRLAFRNKLGVAFFAVCLAGTLVGVVFLAFLLFDVWRDGAGFLRWEFIQNFPSRFPERAGFQSALWGSFWLVGTTALLAFPIGVGAAIYLEEYAQRSFWTRAIQTNIANLAGGALDRLRHPRAAVVRARHDRHRAEHRGRLRALDHRRRRDDGAAGPADRDRRLAGVDPGGAAVTARGLLRGRRDALADSLASRAAAGVPGDHDRHDPGAVAGDRRDGAADHDRRADLRGLPARVAAGPRSR